MHPVHAQIYRFGAFELHVRTGELRKHDLKIRLQEQPCRILLMLLEHPGEVVLREEIRKKLWPDDTIVEFDHSINAAIRRLRDALGDSADEPRYVETLERRGYRFLGPVEVVAKQPPGVSVNPPAIELASLDLNALVGKTKKSDSSIVARLSKGHKKVAMGGVVAAAALVALAWFLLHRPSKPSSELAQKRLTFNSSENPVQSEALSPDGEYLAYSDPAGIHLKLLSTSEERVIPLPAGSPADAYWLLDSWFPDGTQLLADMREPDGHKSLWTISVLGQSPRLLREDAVGFGVSPDGTHIAFGRSWKSDHIREIWVMGIQGDNPQTILTVGENEWLQWVHWSPDGQRLGYIRDQGSWDPPHKSIETVKLMDGNRTTVLPADPLLNDFCWLPEGRIVYARRDSLFSGDDNLWQIDIDNHAGTATGKPRRMTQWAGFHVQGLSASANGKRMVFYKRMIQVQVYIAELIADGSRVRLSRPLSNADGYLNPTAWMPDSKALLFHSNRNGTVGIFKQGISQNTVEPIFIGPRGAAGARLSSDAAWIVFFETAPASANTAAGFRLMRIPASGGVPQFVLETPTFNVLDMRCAPAPVNLCLIAETSQDRKKFMLTAFDPLKGRGKVLRTIERDPSHDYGGALSADGSTYAISSTGGPDIHIQLLSLSGGADRQITVKGWPGGTNLDWSVEGKGFYCSSQSSQGSTLLYVDLKGNARVLWQNKGGGEIWGMPSPDGRYLAIQATAVNSNIWMLEGF